MAGAATAVHAATKYASDVVSGEIIAGPYVRAAAARHLRDLERAAAGWTYHFDERKADKAIEFIKTFCYTPDGVPMQPFEEFIIGSIFGWVNADTDYRRFRRAYGEIGKGNRKTPLAASIGVYGLVADGEDRPEIYSAAVTRDQAKICFGDAHAICDREGGELREVLDVSTHNISNPANGGWLRAVSSEHKGLDGKRVHMGIIDELHEHPTDLVLDKISKGVKARRQSLIFMITNSGNDRKSVCWREHEYAVNVVTGIVEDETEFVYVTALDEHDDWTDESVWIKANPGLGTILPVEYLRNEVRQALGKPSSIPLTKRLNFCIWTEAFAQWLDMDAWGEAERAWTNWDADDRAIALADAECFGGLDLSRTNDLTAFAKLWRLPPAPGDAPIIEEDGEGQPIELRYRIAIDVEFWIPDDELVERERRDGVPYGMWGEQGHISLQPGRVVDYDPVRDSVLRARDANHMLQVGYDPWNAPDLVKGLERENAPLVAISQTIAGLTAACKALERLLLSGRVYIRPNPVLRWNAASVAIMSDTKGNIMPNKAKSTQRIDGIAATITAMACLVRTPTAAEPDFEITYIDFD